MRLNMSGCPSLYSFMGILWNGDVVRCCNDWRARRDGKCAGAEPENHLGEREYRWMRAMSDAGRLNEVELCGDCGENRFTSIRQCCGMSCRDSRASGRVRRSLGILETIDAFRKQTPELIQLGLMRP